MAGIAVDVAPEVGALPEVLRKRRHLPHLLAVLVHNRLALCGVVVLFALALVALLAPVFAPPADPTQPYLIPRDGYIGEPAPPTAGHPFGTAPGQYDIYYGVIWGTRTAFKVGLLLPALTLLIGALLGAGAAFIGGWVDEIVQRVVEIFMAFPFLLAALTMASLLAPKLHDNQLSAMIALVAFGWTGYARLIRGEVLAIKDRDYILAARVTGVPNTRILLRHILPNALNAMYVYVALDVAGYVLAFSGLGFLGLGPGEGYADWGQMLSASRDWVSELFNYWYIVVFPGGALMLFSLSWNLIGDALRDAFDPRMRGTQSR